MTDKQIFAEYADSAPRLDLAFYVTHAQRHRDEYSPETRAIVSEMIALLDDLQEHPRGSAASRKRVWALIARFRSSTGPTPHVDPQQHEAEMMQTQVALWVTRGARSVLLDPKTPPIEAAVPVHAAPAKVQPVNWKARALAAEAALAELRTKPAPTPITKPRTAVDWKAAGRKAWETRQRNLATKREAA